MNWILDVYPNFKILEGCSKFVTVALSVYKSSDKHKLGLLFFLCRMNSLIYD